MSSATNDEHYRGMPQRIVDPEDSPFLDHQWQLADLLREWCFNWPTNRLKAAKKVRKHPAQPGERNDFISGYDYAYQEIAGLLMTPPAESVRADED